MMRATLLLLAVGLVTASTQEDSIRQTPTTFSDSLSCPDAPSKLFDCFWLRSAIPGSKLWQCLDEQDCTLFDTAAVPQHLVNGYNTWVRGENRKDESIHRDLRRRRGGSEATKNERLVRRKDNNPQSDNKPAAGLAQITDSTAPTPAASTSDPSQASSAGQTDQSSSATDSSAPTSSSSAPTSTSSAPTSSTPSSTTSQPSTSSTSTSTSTPTSTANPASGKFPGGNIAGVAVFGAFVFLAIVFLTVLNIKRLRHCLTKRRNERKIARNASPYASVPLVENAGSDGVIAYKRGSVGDDPDRQSTMYSRSRHSSSSSFGQEQQISHPSTLQLYQHTNSYIQLDNVQPAACHDQRPSLSSHHPSSHSSEPIKTAVYARRSISGSLFQIEPQYDPYQTHHGGTNGRNSPPMPSSQSPPTRPGPQPVSPAVNTYTGRRTSRKSNRRGSSLQRQFSFEGGGSDDSTSSHSRTPPLPAQTESDRRSMPLSSHPPLPPPSMAPPQQESAASPVHNRRVSDLRVQTAVGGVGQGGSGNTRVSSLDDLTVPLALRAGSPAPK